MPDGRLQASRGLALACAAGLVGSLDSALNIAFPDLSDELDLGVPAVQWVVIAYVLTYASLLLGCGRLGDVVGHRRVLQWGLAGSTAAFLATGLAPSYPWLLAARVLQGVAVALVLAAAPALVTLAAPPERRGRAVGLFQMAAALGLAAGPFVGGVLVDWWGWRSVFLFRAPLAAVLLAVALRTAARPPARPPSAAPTPSRPPEPENARDESISIRRDGFLGGKGGSGILRRIDLPGAVMLAAGTASALFGLRQSFSYGPGDPLVIAALLVGVVTLSAFVAHERKASAPLIDLALFANPAFSIANALNFLANATMFAIWLLGPYYAVNVLSLPAKVGGLVLGAAPAATALTAAVAGRLSDRIGTGPISSLGLGVETLGLVAVSRLDASSGPWWTISAFALVGVGLGLFQAPNMAFVMGGIARTQQGVAAGMSQMMRTSGVVIGVAAASALYESRRSAHLARLGDEIDAFVPAFRDVFLAAAAVCAAAAALSLVRSGSRRRPDERDDVTSKRAGAA